nr:MAG TPA: hypothetical protein [Caudoviricetes sp.]
MFFSFASPKARPYRPAEFLSLARAPVRTRISIYKRL